MRFCSPNAEYDAVRHWAQDTYKHEMKNLVGNLYHN